MDYIGDKEYWDVKFDSRNDNPLNPEKSLVESIGYFKKGNILDIACGDGRNALFLLDRGFNVTGVDFSSKALDKLRHFAERGNHQIRTVQVDSKIRKQDLIQPSDFEGMGKSFELVNYIEDKDERGFFVTYIFRKR